MPADASALKMAKRHQYRVIEFSIRGEDHSLGLMQTGGTEAPNQLFLLAASDFERLKIPTAMRLEVVSAIWAGIARYLNPGCAAARFNELELFVAGRVGTLLNRFCMHIGFIPSLLAFPVPY